MYIAGGWYVARYNYTDSRSDGNSNSNTYLPYPCTRFRYRTPKG
jgi:hypothetical protein